MTWWGWVILGSVLFGAELFAVDAQFYLVFLGLSAVLVGLGGMIGIAAPEWAQWLTFAMLSLLSMLTFRKSLYRKLRGNVTGFKEGIAGEYVSLTNTLAPGATGSVEFRGTNWSVKNVGNQSIDAGSSVKVSRTEGLTLHVTKD